jgi:serine/threonine-protein kinase
MDASGGLSSSTKTGSVLGTPYFMSPEQARGLRSIDHRSDLWSIAVIAYRCLIGELPFQGEAMGDLLVQICTAPLPVPSQRVPGLPPALDAWFSRALAREPAQRFQHAHELAESLAQIAGAGRAPAFSAATLEAALASAPTVAGAYDSGRLAGPAEGVTGAPFVSQSQGRPKRPASIGLIVGIGAGTALFLLIGALVLVLGRKGSAAEAPITAIPPIAPGASAPESSAVVVAAPPSAVPTVEPALAPPPSAGVSANPEISDQPHVGKTLKTFKGSGGGTGKPPTSGKGGTDIGY